MSNASTRAHADSPSAAPPIPVADPKIQPSTPRRETDGNTPIPTLPPATSRKEKRLAKKTAKSASTLPTPPPSDTDTSTRSKPPNNPPKSKKTQPTIPPPMSAAKPSLQKAYPLLVCSLGNPGAQYADTLHSAGHIVLSYLAERKYYKPFSKGLSGLVALPNRTVRRFDFVYGFRSEEGPAKPIEEDWTFWKSTSLMNLSGRGVGHAYTEWLRSIRTQYGDAALEGRLVVLHDELESAFGKVTVRDGAASAKGHNGLKSCQASLGKTRWWRVGVGIGRPESREPDVVSRYVLEKVSNKQKMVLEDSAKPVMDALEEIAEGKK